MRYKKTIDELRTKVESSYESATEALYEWPELFSEIYEGWLEVEATRRYKEKRLLEKVKEDLPVRAYRFGEKTVQKYLTEHPDLRGQEVEVIRCQQTANAWDDLLDACKHRHDDIVQAILKAVKERLMNSPESFMNEEALQEADVESLDSIT